MAGAKEKTIEELNELAALCKGDPEAVHDMAIQSLLQYLDASSQSDVAVAYRAANKYYWAADCR